MSSEITPKQLLYANRRQQGTRAEEIASQYLEEQGYRILKRNLHTPFGEIDILAKKSGCYICVEVRSRWCDSGVDPSTSISATKYSHLVRSLLSLQWLHNQPAQIDLITVEKARVTHHYQAIEAPSG